MKHNLKLPKSLELEYNAINQNFDKIHDTWKQYSNETIPIDPKSAKKIIEWRIKLIRYIIKNYTQIDLEECTDFLANLQGDFYYGPNGDNSTYLNSIHLDGEPIEEFCFEMRYSGFKLTKKELNKVKSKYIKVLSQLNKQKGLISQKSFNYIIK